ncbi:MAG: SPW repeat protein [Bacteroidota bacterium]
MKGSISQTFFSYFNYLLAAVMMSSPWLFGFVHIGGAALFFPFMFGWHQLLMAIFSNTKGGMVRVFPIQMHCTLNVITGFVLMVTPWMYGFAGKGVWLPHLVMGAIVFILGMYTKNSPMINEPHEMLKEGGIQSTDSHEGRMMI